MMLSSFGTALSAISNTTSITRNTLMGLVGDFKNLSVQQIAQIALSGEMSKADLFAALQKAGLTREERKLIAARLEEAGATGASTAATVTDTGAKVANKVATFSLTKAAKGLWAVLKANPLLLIAAGVAAVIAAWKIADNMFTITLDAQRKKTQKLTDEYNTLAQEVQSLEGELATIKQRIQEINALDKPTFTDEQELRRLETQVALLERERDLKKEAAQEKADETNESVQSEYDRQYKTVGELTGANTYHSIYDFVDYDARGQKVKVGKAISGEQYYEELIRKIKELNDLRDNTNAEDWVGSADERALADYTAKLQNMSTEFGTLATKVTITDSASIALYDSLADMADMGEAVANGDYWSFLLNKAGKDNIQEKADELKGLSDSLAVADTTEKTAQAAQKLQAIISQDTGLSNMISQAEGLGYAAEGSLSALTAWDGTIEGMTPDVAEAANAIGQLITWLFEVSGASNDGATPAVNSLKTALAGLSDETTVLRDAMAKLGEGSAAFDKWIGSDDNLKSLLDKFPNLRDELEAYEAALTAGEDPQKAFITLQRAMNAAMADFNTDVIYEGINDVVSASDTYGASSNQVLQAVQNLDRLIPGLVDKLYTEENGHLTVASGVNFSAAAIYNAAKETIELEKVAGKAKFDGFVAQVDNVSDALMRMGGTAAIAVSGLNPYVSLQETKDQYLKDLDSLLASLNGAYSRIRNDNKKSKKEKDVYVPDVDSLYQYLQTVEDINNDLERLDLDEKLLDEDDFEGKNKLIEERIAKLEELKTALHELNNARDVEISAAVGKLNGYGNFQAAYDVKSGQALIGNMDALKGLTGDTAKAAEALISTIENGSKAALSTSNEYMEALVEQNSLLKEQRELQEGASDDRIERHRNAISLLQNQQGVYEGNLDYQAAVNSLKEQKSHWVEIQNIAHQMAEEIRAAHPGITDDDPLLEKWIDLWWEANNEIGTANEKFVEDSLARLDSFIQQADNFNWWDNIDITKVDMLEKKLETIHQLYADGIIPDAATYKKLVDETAKEIYDEKLNAIEQVIDYTKKLIEEEVRLRKEELEEQVDDYKKIVDLKKESLRASKEEADYQKSVAEKTKAIAKLQQQINTLALSDDRRDIAERKKLEEELAELQGELADTQADHVLEAQEKALDDSYDAFEKEKNDEIKKLEATIDTEGKLYALAIQRIDNGWDALYSDLMEMNSLYWDGIAGEAGIKGAWDTAKQAAEGYRGTLETIQGIEKERAAVSGTGTSVGSSSVSDKNAAYLTGDIDKQKQLQAIGAQMQTNSQMWHTAYNANNKGQMEALQKANQRLANKVEELTGQAPVFDSRDGYWKLSNGEHFYEVYHGGTKSAGSNEPWDLKSDEIMAKLQREEAVIPKNQVQPTLRFLEWGNTLASKARELFSGGELVSSAMSDAIKGSPLSPAAGAIVNNNAPSFAPNIQVEVKYDGSASPADAKKFGENITAGITEAFRRKGIGIGATPLLTGI